MKTLRLALQTMSLLSEPIYKEHVHLLVSLGKVLQARLSQGEDTILV